MVNAKDQFDYLNKVCARFLQQDPEYDATKELAYLKNVVEKMWPQLEEQRMESLSEDFDPKNNWWGSQLTKD